MTPERQAELRRLLMPQQPRCRHARDGQDTCGPDVHNLHCSWPACAEPKVLSRDEHEQAMRTALTESLDAVAAREREIEALRQQWEGLRRYLTGRDSQTARGALDRMKHLEQQTGATR